MVFQWLSAVGHVRSMAAVDEVAAVYCGTLTPTALAALREIYGATGMELASHDGAAAECPRCIGSHGGALPVGQALAPASLALVADSTGLRSLPPVVRQLRLAQPQAPPTLIA